MYDPYSDDRDSAEADHTMMTKPSAHIADAEVENALPSDSDRPVYEWTEDIEPNISICARPANNGSASHSRERYTKESEGADKPQNVESIMPNVEPTADNPVGENKRKSKTLAEQMHLGGLHLPHLTRRSRPARSRGNKSPCDGPTESARSLDGNHSTETRAESADPLDRKNSSAEPGFVPTTVDGATQADHPGFFASIRRRSLEMKDKLGH
ncbi:hypothetical protein Q7P35_006815 [Cladosporium inversicolor]